MVTVEDIEKAGQKVPIEEIDQEVERIYEGLLDPQPHTPEQDKMVKAAIRLCLVGFVYHKHDELLEMIGPVYKQHNPNVGDGPKSVIEFDRFMTQKSLDAGYPGTTKLEIKRVLIDGEFIIIQQQGIRYPGDPGIAALDLLRYKDGHFVEHWDCMQPIPAESKNPNGFF